MQYSEAVPFLEKPPMLDGKMAGDVGFDPLGFSNNYDMKWLRVLLHSCGWVGMCPLAFRSTLMSGVETGS
jgi:hypothetical protein